MAVSVRFLNPLDVRETMEGTWVLLHDFYAIVNGIEIIIAGGFETDFASVPRLPFTYAVLGGLGNRAAVLHDYLYSVKLFDRKTCDDLFYAALLQCSVPKWKAAAMYYGVRLGGGSYYNKVNT
jgi:hypothetical protein